MSKIYSNATELVGRTPLVRINRLADGADATILAKLEFYNPANSVKDRIAVAIIDAAVAAGKLPEGGTIVEGTSGNTGIGLAWVGAARGYKVILTMPSSMSKERRALLRAFGAELVLTEPALGMRGAVDKAKEIVASTDGAILASQFANEANPAVHEKTTGEEIWEDTDGKVDYLVSGIGTGGTITGAGRALRRHNPQIKLIAVEPAESPILSGGQPRRIPAPFGRKGRPPQDPRARSELRSRRPRHRPLRRGCHGLLRRGHRAGAAGRHRRGTARGHFLRRGPRRRRRDRQAARGRGQDDRRYHP